MDPEDRQLIHDLLDATIASRRGGGSLHRIRSANVRSVAIVPKPASGHTRHLFKSAGERGGSVTVAAPLIKAGAHWTTAYAVVAEPGHVEAGGIDRSGRVVKTADGQPIADVWTAEAIRQAAHSFAQAGGLTTDGHWSDEPYGHWVESWIAPADVRIGSRLVKSGSWLLGLRPTDEGRRRIDAGELTGVSVEGVAVREPGSRRPRAAARRPRRASRQALRYASAATWRSA